MKRGQFLIDLIFQNCIALPELAPEITGCRGFSGPVPRPLLMSSTWLNPTTKEIQGQKMVYAFKVVID
jgi:hypothetical protein